MMGTKHQKKVRNQELQSAALRKVGVEETPGSTNPQKSVPQKAGLRVRVFIITYVERGHAWVFIIFFLGYFVVFVPVTIICCGTLF
jgi:hypothetical protein